MGVDRSGRQGVYADAGGVLTAIADTSTPIPGGHGNFTSFGYQIALDDGNVAFFGVGPDGQQGLYAFYDGVLTVVADRNSYPDKDFYLGPRALSGRDLAFEMGWRIEAVYLATIPEPATLSMLALGLGCLLRRRGPR